MTPMVVTKNSSDQVLERGNATCHISHGTLQPTTLKS
jgi:hypothetical protein